MFFVFSIGFIVFNYVGSIKKLIVLGFIYVGWVVGLVVGFCK